MEAVVPAPEARASAALRDHILEEILVRIGAPADLARASAACKAFGRLITEPTFRRRYRPIHPPLLLGFVDPISTRGFLLADAPHRKSPAARGFAGAADFSYDHLPRSGRVGWSRYDARDGRVLLRCSDFDSGLVSPEFAAFDPLIRGYTLLPPIPDDLLASVWVQVQDEHIDFFNAFFDPSGGNEDAQFRVMCCMRCFSMAAVFVYSSVSSSWTHCTSIFYAALGLIVQLEDNPIMGRHSYAYGCLYSDVGISNKMIKLDINGMESTTVSLPAGHENRNTVVVEAGEGKGMFSLIATSENPLPLRYSMRQNESENANERLVETIISLPCEYDFYHFDGAANGYIFLIGRQGYPVVRSAFFSLEIKTLKRERLRTKDPKWSDPSPDPAQAGATCTGLPLDQDIEG